MSLCDTMCVLCVEIGSHMGYEWIIKLIWGMNGWKFWGNREDLE